MSENKENELNGVIEEEKDDEEQVVNIETVVAKDNKDRLYEIN